MSGPSRVLVVDDEQSITDFVALGLRHEGFDVRTAPDGHVALRVVDEFKPHLVVLDLMMPRVDGWQLCRALSGDRSRGIIILSARDETSDRVQGLELGADDYLVKPFDFAELLARIRAVLRRRNPDLTRVIQVGNLSIDTATREVRTGDRCVDLSVREYDLLLYLASNAGQVLPRQRILDEVWGTTSSGTRTTSRSTSATCAPSSATPPTNGFRRCAASATACANPWMGATPRRGRTCVASDTLSHRCAGG
jgi:two-component system OmpR family response regulator